MKLFILAIGVILLNFTHITSAVESLRSGLMAYFGRKKFFVVYALDSTLALALIIYGYYGRDFTAVYEPPIWGAEFNKGAMFFAFWLLVSQMFDGFIKQFVKAPAIAGIGVWAFGHLCANGDLHSIILFGGFLIYAWSGLYFKRHAALPDANYHYSRDVKSFFVAFVIYSAVGLLHPYFTGIAVF